MCPFWPSLSLLFFLLPPTGSSNSQDSFPPAGSNSSSLDGFSNGPHVAGGPGVPGPYPQYPPSSEYGGHLPQRQPAQATSGEYLRASRNLGLLLVVLRETGKEGGRVGIWLLGWSGCDLGLLLPGVCPHPSGDEMVQVCVWVVFNWYLCCSLVYAPNLIFFASSYFSLCQATALFMAYLW